MCIRLLKRVILSTIFYVIKGVLGKNGSRETAITSTIVKRKPAYAHIKPPQLNFE